MTVTAKKHEEQKPQPTFTEAQLRAIHHTLFKVAWQSEHLYDARREATLILDNYFKGDTEHLNHP